MRACTEHQNDSVLAALIVLTQPFANVSAEYLSLMPLEPRMRPLEDSTDLPGP